MFYFVESVDQSEPEFQTGVKVIFSSVLVGRKQVHSCLSLSVPVLLRHCFQRTGVL